MNRRRFVAAASALATLAMTGCASRPPAPAPAPGQRQWSGRFSLRVDSDPPRHFSAQFELRGGPSAGEMEIISPLGGTLATLRWAPGLARLTSPQGQDDFESLDALTQQVLGTPVPVAVLFDWLDGRAGDAPGWSADFAARASGRIVIQRHAPAPGALLRVQLQDAP